MSENLMSRISSRARAPVSSRNVVNVDDFRAKGDGTDDSQVRTHHKLIRKVNNTRLISSVFQLYLV